MDRSKEFVGLAEKLNVPTELQGRRTSLDSMSPGNPVMRTLADIPLAPGVKGHLTCSRGRNRTPMPTGATPA
jgi:hypothetical protein